MCFSSLLLSRRPKIFKKRAKTLKNPLTPIGSCRDLQYCLRKNVKTPKIGKQSLYIPPSLLINRPFKAAAMLFFLGAPGGHAFPARIPQGPSKDPARIPQGPRKFLQDFACFCTLLAEFFPDLGCFLVGSLRDIWGKYSFLKSGLE